MATITVTRHEDGTMTADDFPAEIQIADALFEAADPRVLSVDGEARTFTLRTANGWATYRFDTYFPLDGYWTAVRLARGV